MLKAGFGRIDITPPLGSYLQGYQDPRYAKGVLDPLTANALAFDDGEKRAVIIVCDLVGISQEVMEKLRPTVAEIANLAKEVPRYMINEKGDNVTEEFIKYARPLIEGELMPIMENGLPKHIKR